MGASVGVVEFCAFTYDGGTNLSVTITAAVPGVTYRMFSSDTNSTAQSVLAVTTTVVINITDVGGDAAGYRFRARVQRLDNNSYVGVDGFAEGTSGSAEATARWATDAADPPTVTITFPSTLGTNYKLVVLSDGGQVLTSAVGNGVHLQMSTTGLSGIVDGYIGQLVNDDTDEDLISRLFVAGIAGAGFPGNPLTAPISAGSFESPLWRYFLANLDGDGIVDLSKLAADRVVELVLNAPLSMTGTVPSDNPQVWLPDGTDGDPYVASGTRLLWGFRRESMTVPYYVPRAATLVQLIEDAAAQDDARTRFTGYDPWRYLFARPVCNADGSLPGANGISFTATQASVVIATLLGNTIANQGHAYVDAGVTYIGTGFYTGTLETGAGMAIDINFPQGTSVGQAWQMVTDMNVCDIILEPIYDPFNRPNYLCQLNVYAQAGAIQDEQIFAWNAPGRSLVGLNRVEDMTQAANQIVYFTGQGGVYDRPTGPIATDAASIVRFGEYWAQQFFPGQKEPTVVLSLADRQLSLRKDGKETVTFKPAPERSPRPWQDYNLGDRCPVYAKKEGFRRALGRQFDGTTIDPQYQRIYGWTTNISDDALETIDPVLTSPGGFTA